MYNKQKRYKMIECKQCNKLFEPGHHNTIICSDKCRKDREAEYNKAYLRKKRVKKGWNPKSQENLYIYLKDNEGHIPVSSQVIQKNNKTGYIGIYYSRTYKKYFAKIQYKGKIIFSLGSEDIDYLVKRRDEYIIKHNLPHKLNKEL